MIEGLILGRVVQVRNRKFRFDINNLIKYLELPNNTTISNILLKLKINWIKCIRTVRIIT